MCHQSAHTKGSEGVKSTTMTKLMGSDLTATTRDGLLSCTLPPHYISSATTDKPNEIGYGEIHSNSPGSDNCHMGPSKAASQIVQRGCQFPSVLFQWCRSNPKPISPAVISGRGEELRSLLLLRWLTLEQQTFPDVSGSIEAVELKGILPAAPPAPN